MGDKDKRRARFERKGGTGKRHKGRCSHAHHGSGCNHASIPGVDKLTEQDHRLKIERHAARLGAVIDE